MQGLQRLVGAAVLTAWCAGSVWAGGDSFAHFGLDEPIEVTSVVIAERVQTRISAGSTQDLPFHVREISVPGASFIKLHFSEFNLPDGIEVEISNPDGSEVWGYASNKPNELTIDAAMGDDGVNRFSAMSITGDTAIVRVVGDPHLFDPSIHRLEIDSWLEGFSAEKSVALNRGTGKSELGNFSQTQNACGSDERYDSVCWANSNPWEYNRSAAVAKLITSRGEVCTAWRVGPDNHLFTAKHCLGKQSELDGSEIWFDYESSSCGGSSSTSAVKVTGGSLLTKSSSLDFTLFSVSNFSRIAQFPSFGLETSTPAIGEPIFIPQHGLGEPRQIAIESDMNSSGQCEVDALDLDGYAPGSDLGYYCDTVTSSSGAPVVSTDSGRVVALHHFGGCLNAGVKMSAIWPAVRSYFGGQVPDGSSGGSAGGSSTSGNDAPEAAFEYSCDDLSCRFDGSGSLDRDGEIVAFSWDLGDGQSHNGQSFNHEFTAEGNYEVTLTVEDDEGEFGYTTQSITLTAPNQEPRARFSYSCIANSCEFDASRTSDPDGSIASVDWTLGDGNTATGYEISHVYDEAGHYTVRLVATDDEDAWNATTHQIVIVLPNEAPNANFDFSCDDLDCSFNSASSDSDGELVSWSWSFGDGSSAQGREQNHTFGSDGNYTVTLVVADDDGATDDLSRSVKVVTGITPPKPEPEPEPEPATNQEPVAEFSFSCDELDCVFNAESSHDPDGTVVNYAWSFGDNNSASGSQVSHQFKGTGAYEVILAVTDDNGAIDKRSQAVSVEVQRSNSAPRARFTRECDELACLFDAGSSQDTDGFITEYRWTLGDGSSMTGQSVQYNYRSAGTFIVTLEVKDDSGESSSTSRTVEVGEEAPVISLYGTGSLNNGKNIATLRWSGAESQFVVLYRDGIEIANTLNDGKLIDTTVSTRTKAAAYRVCQVDLLHCSDTLMLYFN
jgi:PKD repeat protein